MSVKKLSFFLLLLMLTLKASAQISFSELDDEMKKQPKNIVMLISSQSCIYCLMQEKKLKNSNNLYGQLNSEVYFLSWKVEEQGKLTFNGISYTSGMEFSKSFSKGGFPLWLAFDKNYNLLYTHSGLLSVENIKKILRL